MVYKTKVSYNIQRKRSGNVKTYTSHTKA